MIKSATHIKLSNFLDTSSQALVSYKIPNYQREYAWGKNECEELINDINENDDGYFLGSIIWVDTTKEIIDGQQRITTLSLILMAIYSQLPHTLDDEEKQADKINLKRMLSNKDNSSRLALQEQNKNQEDYQYLLSSIVLKKGASAVQPKNFGNRRLSWNFEKIKELIKDYSIDELFSLYAKICNLTFVSIVVDDYQSAFQLFEAMNNRGVPLSALDLIKNKFIAKRNDIANWKKLIELLGDDYSNQEQFLRNNYNAFRAEYNGYDIFNNGFNLNEECMKYTLSVKATRSNIINIYSQLIEKNSDFINALLTRAQLYSVMLGLPDSAQVSKGLCAVLTDFRHANATSSFMLLLYLLNYQSEFDLSDEQLIYIFNYILKFFIRRNFTNNPSTGKIPQILMDIIEQINICEIKNYGSIFKIISTVLISQTSNDEILKSVLEGDLYESNVDMTRYILCKIEQEANTNLQSTKEKKYIDLWEKEKPKDENSKKEERVRKYIWTIEHVFPEGKNIPQCWVDMIANGSKDLANEYLHNYTHKIGNLTITGYNSNLSNKPFSEKKTKCDDAGNPIGYNNGLYLNKYIYEQNSWTIDNIKTRTTELVSKIMIDLNLNNYLKRRKNNEEC